LEFDGKKDLLEKLSKPTAAPVPAGGAEVPQSSPAPSTASPDLGNIDITTNANFKDIAGAVKFGDNVRLAVPDVALGAEGFPLKKVAEQENVFIHPDKFSQAFETNGKDFWERLVKNLNLFNAADNAADGLVNSSGAEGEFGKSEFETGLGQLRDAYVPQEGMVVPGLMKTAGIGGVVGAGLGAALDMTHRQEPAAGQPALPQPATRIGAHNIVAHKAMEQRAAALGGAPA
jgi:hypothetical protein